MERLHKLTLGLGGVHIGYNNGCVFLPFGTSIGHMVWHIRVACMVSHMWKVDMDSWCKPSNGGTYCTILYSCLLCRHHPYKDTTHLADAYNKRTNGLYLGPGP